MNSKDKKIKGNISVIVIIICIIVSIIVGSIGGFIIGNSITVHNVTPIVNHSDNCVVN